MPLLCAQLYKNIFAGRGSSELIAILICLGSSCHMYRQLEHVRSRLIFLSCLMGHHNFFLTQYLLPFNSQTPLSSVTPSNNLAPSSRLVPSNSVVPSKSEVSMLARKYIFLGLSFLAKPSCDSRELREAVDGNKCSQFHRANIVRVSRECRTNVARMS